MVVSLSKEFNDRTDITVHLYEMTAVGRELWPVLHALLVWGGRHRHTNSRVFRHASCGTRLNEDAACPPCKVAPDVADIVMERRRGRGRFRDDPVALRGPHRLLEPVETTSPHALRSRSRGGRCVQATDSSSPCAARAPASARLERHGERAPSRGSPSALTARRGMLALAVSGVRQSSHQLHRYRKAAQLSGFLRWAQGSDGDVGTRRRLVVIAT